MGGHQMSVEEVKKHVKGYYMVFAALLVLTGVTVAVSYLHLSVMGAVLVALAVASTKGSLVALYFMHLISEKAIIYATLALTAILLLSLMMISLYLTVF